MRTITLEEHFVTHDFIKATDAYGADTPPQMQEMREKLLDVGEGRLRAMDEAQIDMQVLSLAALGWTSCGRAMKPLFCAAYMMNLRRP